MRWCPDCEVSHDPMVSCETIDELRFPSSEMDDVAEPTLLCMKCGSAFAFGLLDDDGICDDCRMSLDEQLATSLNVVWPVLNGVCGHTLAKRENFRTGLEKWCDECRAWVAVRPTIVPL
jgi:hypothetical protein